MPVRPGNPISDRNMAGVKYKSDAPEDATAVVSGDINRPEGEGLAQDAPVGDNADAVTAEDGKPNRSDSKGEWEAYARSQGLDPEGMTKDELIDAIG